MMTAKSDESIVKHLRFLRKLAIVTLVSLSTIEPALSQTAPSVPNLIAYQGRVTLAGGRSVADGSYPAMFTIYNYSSGGVSLWFENTNVTTNSGTLSHNLGSAVALPSTLTVANYSLSLAIVFDGDLLSPQTRIVCDAFSLTADQLAMNNGSGVVALRTDPTNHQMSEYGSDSAEQVCMGGGEWPQLVLDANAVNGSPDDRTNTLYLLAQELRGTAVVETRHLSLAFFPTAYGTVEGPSAEGPDGAEKSD